MTTDEQYEEKEKEFAYVFGERKAINKKFLLACERKVNSLAVKETENPAKWIIGKLAFQELDDIWDNFRILSHNLNYAIQNLDHRIQALEDVAIELDAKVNSKDIASAVKFTKEFKKQIEESRKKLEEYKLKMAENDLAT
jgi:hypothetical protein